jgi:hypothetical protein
MQNGKERISKTRIKPWSTPVHLAVAYKMSLYFYSGEVANVTRINTKTGTTRRNKNCS